MSIKSKIDKTLVEHWVNEHEVLQFLQATIRCNTINPPGNEMVLAEMIQKKFNEYGIDCTVRDHGENRGNLIARIKGKKPGKHLVFSAHLDTVDVGNLEWDIAPHSAEIKHGKLYGRGSTDMKSGLVGLMYAMIICELQGLIEYGELTFVATFGEETGSIGAKYLMESEVVDSWDAMIIGEPTANELIIAHKGAVWLTIESMGKTGHSSMPSEGVNAIEGLIVFLDEIRKRRIIEANDNILTDSTMVLTNIEGGKSLNVIPDYCKANLDLRTLPSQDNSVLIEKLKDLAKDLSENQENFPQLEIQCINNLSSVKTDPNSEIVQIASSILEREGREGNPRGMNYFTDGSVFSELSDLDIIILGPGIPALAHQPNEYVEIDKFIESIYLYLQIAKEYLNGDVSKK